MTRQPQCSQIGASRWIAHSKLSKTCRCPAVMTSKLREYSLPQTSHWAMSVRSVLRWFVRTVTATCDMHRELTTVDRGDKTLFFDDFSELSKAGGSVRQLTVTQRGSIFLNITAVLKNNPAPPPRPHRVDLVATLHAAYQELGRKWGAAELGRAGEARIYPTSARSSLLQVDS